MDDATLNRLLQDNPTVVAAVVAALEERQKAIALAQEEERLRDEAERAWVEGKDILREMETAKRARAEAYNNDDGEGHGTHQIFSGGVRAPHTSLVHSVWVESLQTAIDGLRCRAHFEGSHNTYLDDLD